MISLNNISFSYDNEKIIDNLTATLDKGVTYCIMGPSGIGKTTLLKIISGLLNPESGNIKGTENLKKSFVFQENRLLPWLTVEDNLKYVSDNIEDINNALSDTMLIDSKNKNVKELSGGMARRAAIARAAAYNGELYFIDEPLYGLDIKTSESILAILKKIIKNKTAFIITHSPEEAFYLADKVIFIDSKPFDKLEIIDKSAFSSSEEIRKKIL